MDHKNKKNKNIFVLKTTPHSRSSNKNIIIKVGFYNTHALEKKYYNKIL